MIHPTLHTSVFLEYLWDPNSISGDRYHLVATYYDSINYFYSSWVRLLTKPKSHILTKLWNEILSHSLLIRILDGFKSLWINCAECKYFKALKIWKITNLKCTVYKISYLCLTKKIPY